MKFKIFAPSYKRSWGVKTQEYLPECTIVVARSEAPAYRKAGVRIWAVPNSAQGNLCRVRNYILDHCGSKAVLILDDDLKGIFRWNRGKARRLETEEVMEFLEHGFNLAEELGARFWGLNCVFDKFAYRENTPFSLLSYLSYIGGPFQAHNGNPLRYDESLPLKEDYDMTLQALNRFRKVLRFNAYFYTSHQHVQPGGCASYRTLERERENFERLLKKWGPKIVHYDDGASKTHRRKRNAFDFNPIVKVPIRGV